MKKPELKLKLKPEPKLTKPVKPVKPVKLTKPEPEPESAIYAPGFDVLSFRNVKRFLATVAAVAADAPKPLRNALVAVAHDVADLVADAAWTVAFACGSSDGAVKPNPTKLKIHAKRLASAWIGEPETKKKTA